MINTSPPFKYVFFDAGGTLLGTNTDSEHWYEQFFVDVCAEQGHCVTVHDVGAALHAAVTSFPGNSRCSTPEQVRTFWEHVYAGAFAMLVPGCDPRLLASHYIDRFETGEYVELFQDTLPALEMIRAGGIRAAVVSNFGIYLHRFIERTGIAPYFEFVVVSAAEGCEKPHPEIFQRALERVSVPPGEVLFVGDHPVEDYAASERLGMFPVLVDRHARYKDKPQLRRVQRLEMLMQYLKP